MGQVKPRIALVIDFLFTYSGAERVLSDFHELYPEAPIYTLFAEPEVVAKHFPKATIITSFLQNSPVRRIPQLLLTQMPLAIESFDFSEYDIVLSNSGAFSHAIITGPDTTHICYCLSPMRYAWDWHHEYLQEKGLKGPGLLAARKILSHLRLWDRVAVSRVDHWIAISQAVAARIEKFYRQPSTIIYPPVNTGYFDPSLVNSIQQQPYAVSASRLTKNKRLDLIIRACAQTGLPLHILGDGKERKNLEKLAQEVHASVTFRGFVSEEEKREELAGAQCFIFAAEDDFGIAPVESLSMGVPVISFAGGGMLDVIKSGVNGYLFPEATTENLSETLQQFLNRGVSATPENIRKSALPFSRERFLEEIKAYVETH